MATPGKTITTVSGQILRQSAAWAGGTKQFRPIYHWRNINRANQRIENEIPGLPYKVMTWERSLAWKHVDCPQDAAAAGHEKRDRFTNRSEIECKFAVRGAFEYAIAYAPKIDNGQERKHSYAVKCSLCGAGHNWCAFYRDAVTKEYLGHSGTVCFAEVCRSLEIPHAEAVIEDARRQRAHAEVLAAVYRKMEDFRADFPGLLEMSTALCSSENPYARLMQETMGFLDEARGVSEAVLIECEQGKYDREYNRGVYEGPHYKYRKTLDQSARLIPQFLMWCRDALPQVGNVPAKVVEGLKEMAGKEPEGSFFRKVRKLEEIDHRTEGVTIVGLSPLGIDTTPFVIPNPELRWHVEAKPEIKPYVAPEVAQQPQVVVSTTLTPQQIAAAHAVANAAPAQPAGPVIPVIAGDDVDLDNPWEVACYLYHVGGVYVTASTVLDVATHKSKASPSQRRWMVDHYRKVCPLVLQQKRDQVAAGVQQPAPAPESITVT